MTRAYARIYYDDLMREFPDVYQDDSLLSTWVRLLVLAEKMWPIPPEIPRSVRIKTYQRLVEAKLVVPSEGQTYRIRGLDAERNRRRNAGRIGAAVRWYSEGNADRNANAYANAMPRRDETRTRQDETKETRASANGKTPSLKPMRSSPTVLEAVERIKAKDQA